MRKYRKPLFVIFVCLYIAAIAYLFWLRFGVYEFHQQPENWDDVIIEIVEIDGWIDSTHYTNTPYEESYSEEKITVVSAVEDNAAFIRELQTMECIWPLGTPFSSISGKAIRLIYPNSDIELITQQGSAMVYESEISVYTTVLKQEHFFAFWRKWAGR